jgi:ABC-2 type transport system permease protein
MSGHALLGSVYAKSVRDQRWALTGWSIGVFLLVLTEAAVWPTMRDMPDLQRFLDSYPKALRELFNLDAMVSGTGFMNAELFTLMLPMLFIFFGVTRGSRMIAGEEEAGSLEVVLVTPVSTRALVLQKTAALVSTLVVLGLVLVLVLSVCSTIFGLGIGIGDVLAGSLAMVLLGAEFGCLALAIGAMTGRRAVALGLAGSAAVAAYVLYALGLIVDAVEPWQPLSPFQQALAHGPLGGSPPLSLVWVAAAALLVVTASVPVFGRRDLRSH